MELILARHLKLKTKQKAELEGKNFESLTTSE